MNKQRVLMVLVAADVILAFSVIGSEMFFSWTLPGSLREYASAQDWLPGGPFGAARFMLWGLSVLATVVAWVGLLNFWWFARRLYTVAWATWMLLVLFSGPSVMNLIGAMFDTMQSVVGGAILSLVYFSDLSRCFTRSRQEISNGAHANA